MEPGEAPINIKNDIKSRPAVLKLLIEYVEKPAVLVETLQNSAPIQEMSSVSFISTVPMIIKLTLTESTTFVCIENFFHLKCLAVISLITKKPIPPKKMREQVTRFNNTLSLYAIKLTLLFTSPDKPKLSKPELLKDAIE